MISLPRLLPAARKALALRFPVLIAFGVCCAVSTRLALANNGVEGIATTVEQLGRGGAYIAAEPGADALHGNPGALAFLKWPEFSVDLELAVADPDYRGGLDIDPYAKRQAAPVIIYAAPLGRRWGWAAGLRAVPNVGARFREYDLGLVGDPRHNRIYDAALAYRLDRRTAVGATLDAGHMDVDFKFLGDSLGFDVNGVSGLGYALKLGLYQRASADTTLGLIWRSRSHLTGRGGQMLTGPRTELQGAIMDNVEMRGFNFPEMYGAGIGQRISERARIFAEYRHLRWGSAMQSLNFYYGGEEPATFNLGWRDQDVYVLGAELGPWGAKNELWRFGANYSESPVPAKTVNPVFPNIAEWHLGAGYERDLDRRWRLATSVLWSPRHEQMSNADNRFNLLFGGDDFYSVSTASLVFGVSLSLRLGGQRDSERAAAEAKPQEADATDGSSAGPVIQPGQRIVVGNDDDGDL